MIRFKCNYILDNYNTYTQAWRQEYLANIELLKIPIKFINEKNFFFNVKRSDV